MVGPTVAFDVIVAPDQTIDADRPRRNGKPGRSIRWSGFQSPQLRRSVAGMRVSLRGFALTIAMASVVVACAPQARSTDLAAEPESSLAPASATALGGGGHDAANTIEGPAPAERFTIFGTFDDDATVERFYRTSLEGQGWVPGGGSSGIPAIHELRVAAWQKDGLIFRLAFWKVEEWRNRSKVGLEFPTIFDASLITAPRASGD
jgi:hypothetical protein